jgi:Ca2+-binding EF-hand superfamily protein
MIDKNGDKNLSPLEIKEYLKQEPWVKVLLTSTKTHKWKTFFESGRKWMEFFSKMDGDGDGSIDESEFVGFYRDVIKKMMLEANELSKAECFDFGNEMSEASECQDPENVMNAAYEAAEDNREVEEEGRKMFRAMDKNRDNNLTRSEIKNYLKKEHWARVLLTGGEGHTWQSFFSKMDENNDGDIEEEEFVGFYRDVIKPMVTKAAGLPEPAMDDGVSSSGSGVNLSEDTEIGTMIHCGRLKPNHNCNPNTRHNSSRNADQ